MRNQLKELEKNFRTLAKEQQLQSQKSFHDMSGFYYKDDISGENADEELKNMTPDFPKGALAGMSFANEQVADYISCILRTADKLTEKNVHDLLLHIDKNNSVKEEELEDSISVYRASLKYGMKIGFNMAKLEIKEKFHSSI
ncbi:hypothetical protein [Oceanobacillus sojae]|uniref:hypothetical protein n=1 Tax=Oceanobacillus sojae TaxID=582851 RepID=UPI0021A675D1|nr:hypothetical protein [Oceanobacillus sojae]MCT1903956.1 hypothetical protein [Oceanobacillus sojae]